MAYTRAWVQSPKQQKKEKQSQMNNIMLHFKKQGKEETKLKQAGRNDIRSNIKEQKYDRKEFKETKIF